MTSQWVANAQANICEEKRKKNELLGRLLEKFFFFSNKFYSFLLFGDFLLLVTLQCLADAQQNTKENTRKTRN